MNVRKLNKNEPQNFVFAYFKYNISWYTSINMMNHALSIPVLCKNKLWPTFATVYCWNSSSYFILIFEHETGFEIIKKTYESTNWSLENLKQQSLAWYISVSPIQCRYKNFSKTWVAGNSDIFFFSKIFQWSYVKTLPLIWGVLSYT